MGQHGDTQPGFPGKPRQHLIRQASALGAKQQGISSLKLHLCMQATGLGGAGEDTRTCKLAQGCIQAGVNLEIAKLVIIQARPAQLAVFQPKAKRLDQMQNRASIGGKPYDIAGIGRNLWLVEQQMTQWHRRGLGHDR